MLVLLVCFIGLNCTEFPIRKQNKAEKKLSGLYCREKFKLVSIAFVGGGVLFCFYMFMPHIKLNSGTQFC